jgi:integrase
MYSKALGYFMSYLRLSPGDYDKLLDKDPKSIQMDICDFVNFMKKEHSSSTVSLYLAALNKFFAMNDITTLNWKKIHSFEGEKEKTIEDRPYTHSEIQLLLEKTTPRNRAIILLMCSAGLRVGALSLKIRDLEPVDRYGIYKVNIYATSKKSRYFTFCSVECRKEIDSYLEWRKRWGERLEPDSPLFRKDFNSQAECDRGQEKMVSPFQKETVRWFMGRLLRDTGIRPIAPLTEIYRHNHIHPRSHIMQCHGFRKFFETNAFKAGMDNLYLRRLMGQKSGLEDSYLKLSEEELLEGDSRHIGYIGVVDALTINEENKLRREIQTLKREVNRFDRMAKEIEELKARIGLS